MNGRVYDYNVGRFMSVDPIIQSPGNSQSVNPYSYLMNNPLAGIDPTGYAGCAASHIPRVCDNTPSAWGGNGQNDEDRLRDQSARAKKNGSENQQTQKPPESTDINAQKHLQTQAKKDEQNKDGELLNSDGWIYKGKSADGIDTYATIGKRRYSGSAGFLTGGMLLANYLIKVPLPHAKVAGAVLGISIGVYIMASGMKDQVLANMRGASESGTGGPGQDPGDRDDYENPGHHDPSGTGRNPYNGTKSVLPRNHQELWKVSRRTSDGNRWAKVGKGKNAQYHRFQNDGNGNWHWNGSTKGSTKSGQPRNIKLNHVPNEVQRW